MENRLFIIALLNLHEQKCLFLNPITMNRVNLYSNNALCFVYQSIIKHKTLIFCPLFCGDLICQMLSKIEKPPIVICVLCRGSVSIRKGDRTRFFNHIINDHEVHYDMELFFALCYLDKEEKETFVNVVKTKNNNGSISTESLLEHNVCVILPLNILSIMYVYYRKLIHL